MIPKSAIEKAIEGGWQYKSDAELLSWQGKALDPFFWRSLENATGKTARAMYLDFCSAVWDADTDGFWAKMKL